jgi:uncharacterized alkaline shock family protein YloU
MSAMQQTDGRSPHVNHVAANTGDAIPATEQVTLPARTAAQPEAQQTLVMRQPASPAPSPAPWPEPEVAATSAGETVVADGVVAHVAATAARAVAGVHELVPRRSGDPVLRLLRRVFGSNTTEIPGVTVKAGRRDVTIILTMTVEFGASIPQVVDTVRTAVTDRVQSLTGLAVREVTIEVVGLYLTDGGERDGR